MITLTARIAYHPAPARRDPLFAGTHFLELDAAQHKRIAFTPNRAGFYWAWRIARRMTSLSHSPQGALS